MQRKPSRQAAFTLAPPFWRRRGVFWQTGKLSDGVWLPGQGVVPYRGRG